MDHFYYLGNDWAVEFKTKMSEFLVFGFGVSGQAAAKLVEHLHPKAKIWVLDQKPLSLSGQKTQTNLKDIQSCLLYTSPSPRDS